MRNIINIKPTTDLHERLKFSIDFINKKDIRHKKILNIGCGYGWLELNIIKYKPKIIIGIEPTEGDLYTAKKNVKDKIVKFLKGNALCLPFSSNSFDTVFCYEVIEHIEKGKEEVLFSEIRRVLKKRGAFYLSTPNKNIIADIFDPAWWLVGHRHYTLTFLVGIAKKYNFTCLRHTIRGRWWSLIGILNLYISKWIFRRDIFFQKLFALKEDKEYMKNGFINIFINYMKV